MSRACSDPSAPQSKLHPAPSPCPCPQGLREVLGPQVGAPDKAELQLLSESQGESGLKRRKESDKGGWGAAG